MYTHEKFNMKAMSFRAYVCRAHSISKASNLENSKWRFKYLSASGLQVKPLAEKGYSGLQMI